MDLLDDPGVADWADLSAPSVQLATHTVSAYPGCLEATVQKRGVTWDDDETPQQRLRGLDAVKIAEKAARRGAATDPVRSQREATRRARSEVRRLILEHQLDHLWTFNLAPEYATHSEDVVRGYIEQFRRNMGLAYGPWLTIIEPHPGGHGWHVHLAVGGKVPIAEVQAAWPFGFVWVEYKSDEWWAHWKARKRRAVLSKADKLRVIAGYLGKYLGKDMSERQVPGSEGRPTAPEDPVPVMGFNRKRYSMSRGYGVRKVSSVHTSFRDAVAHIEWMMGGRCRVVWDSADNEDFEGPHTWMLVLDG